MFSAQHRMLSRQGMHRPTVDSVVGLLCRVTRIVQIARLVATVLRATADNVAATAHAMLSLRYGLLIDRPHNTHHAHRRLLYVRNVCYVSLDAVDFGVKGTAFWCKCCELCTTQTGILCLNVFCDFCPTIELEMLFAGTCRNVYGFCIDSWFVFVYCFAGQLLSNAFEIDQSLDARTHSRPLQFR
jgi:hypothetical protein